MSANKGGPCNNKPTYVKITVEQVYCKVPEARAQEILRKLIDAGIVFLKTELVNE